MSGLVVKRETEEKEEPELELELESESEVSDSDEEKEEEKKNASRKGKGGKGLLGKRPRNSPASSKTSSASSETSSASSNAPRSRQTRTGQVLVDNSVRKALCAWVLKYIALCLIQKSEVDCGRIAKGLDGLKALEIEGKGKRKTALLTPLPEILGVLLSGSEDGLQQIQAVKKEVAAREEKLQKSLSLPLPEMSEFDDLCEKVRFWWGNSGWVDNTMTNVRAHMTDSHENGFTFMLMAAGILRLPGVSPKEQKMIQKSFSSAEKTATQIFVFLEAWAMAAGEEAHTAFWAAVGDVIKNPKPIQGMTEKESVEFFKTLNESPQFKSIFGALKDLFGKMKPGLFKYMGPCVEFFNGQNNQVCGKTKKWLLFVAEEKVATWVALLNTRLGELIGFDVEQALIVSTMSAQTGLNNSQFSIPNIQGFVPPKSRYTPISRPQPPVGKKIKETKEPKMPFRMF